MDAARRALLPTEEAVALLDLTTELAEKELAPRVQEYEDAHRFPMPAATGGATAPLATAAGQRCLPGNTPSPNMKAAACCPTG